MLQFWISITPAEATPSAPPSRGVPLPDRALFDRVLGSRRVRVLGIPETARASSRPEPANWEQGLGKRHAAFLTNPEDDDDPRVVIDEQARAVTITVPYSSTTQIFFTRRNEELLFSGDPRLLHARGMSLDPQAVLCLFEFGALVPPLSLWREVRRLPPGFRTTIDVDTLAWKSGRLDVWGPEPSGEAARDAASQETLVAAELDRVLQRTCPDGRPLILFSGGVDSGLLVARAKALGWNETRLFHYRMSAGDPEGALAERMARALELPLVVRTNDFADWADPIAHLARDYTQPLGDYSMIPTRLLSADVFSHAGATSVVWDGTGADGVFGSFAKLARWQGLYAQPGALRATAGWLYNAGRMWGSDTRLSRRLGAARISRMMPPLLASMIAENPLRGIAYHASDEDARALHERVVRDIEGFAAPLAEENATARVLDLRHIICDFTAQKDAPLFLGAHPDIAYPFLDPRIVRLGFRSAVSWPGPRGESKAVLKRLLANAIGPEMVYRPKSGFTPPIAAGFREGVLRRALEAVLERGHPLAPFLKQRTLSGMVRRAGSGDLPHRVYNFLWMVVSATHWLEQFERMETRE